MYTFKTFIIFTGTYEHLSITSSQHQWLHSLVGSSIAQVQCLISELSMSKMSCIWAFPLCILVLGELIPSSYLNEIPPLPPPPNPLSTKPLVAIRPTLKWDWLVVPRGKFDSTNQKHYPDLVVTRHQYGISALVSQTPFGGETSGSVAKCRLFSRAVMRGCLTGKIWVSG